MFEKTKKFIKEHEETIVEVSVFAIVGAVTAMAGLGVAAYFDTRAKKSIETNGAMRILNRVLNDIPEGTQVRVFGAIESAGLSPNDLGEMGKMMLTEGADELDKFTHFIAIKKV